MPLVFFAPVLLLMMILSTNRCASFNRNCGEIFFCHFKNHSNDGLVAHVPDLQWFVHFVFILSSFFTLRFIRIQLNGQQASNGISVNSKITSVRLLIGSLYSKKYSLNLSCVGKVNITDAFQQKVWSGKVMIINKYTQTRHTSSFSRHIFVVKSFKIPKRCPTC